MRTELSPADRARAANDAAAALGAPPIAAQVGARAPMRGFTDREILTQPDPQYLVADTLPQAGLVQLVGRWGAGKTFVLLDWAMHVAAGMDWQGRYTRRGPVLYIYAEGAMRTRVAAWRSAHHVESGTTLGVTFIPGIVNLLDQAVVAGFAADVVAGAYGAPPAAIVLETLSRMTPGGNENSPETASMVVASCDALQRLIGACVLVSHHTPWDVDKQRPRGHTGLPDAADAIFLLQNTNGALTLTCQKMRDGEAPAPMHLKLTPQDAALVIDAAPAVAADHDDTDERIIAIVTADPTLSRNRITGSVGRNRSVILERINALIGSGVLVNTGTVKKPQWRLNPATVPAVPTGSNGSGTAVHSPVPARPSLGERNREPMQRVEGAG